MKMELSQLERDTAAYFENMSDEEAREERELAVATASIRDTATVGLPAHKQRY